MRDKGRSPLPFQLMTVALWFAGEILGAIVGFLVMGFDGESFSPAVYLFAIVGALLGGAGSILIARSLPEA